MTTQHWYICYWYLWSLYDVHISEIFFPDIEEYQVIRLVNGTRMMKSKERILDTDWSVLDVYDTCESYFSSFMNNFESIYNESFPVMKTKRKYRNHLPWLTAGPWFNIQMSSYKYRKSHCGEKTVLRSSYLHNGISYSGKMSSLYWISARVSKNLSDANTNCSEFPWNILIPTIIPYTENIKIC